jgi:hypothetical protein
MRGRLAAILLLSSASASAQTWAPIGGASANGAIGYRDAGAGRNAALFYGGYTARAEHTRAWLTAAHASALGRLGVRHLYAVPGPVDAGYARREVANSKLLLHLAQIRPAPGLIVVAAHSSGSYVAHELLGAMLRRTPHLLGRVVYYNLDGGSLLLTAPIVRSLAKAYFVYARDGSLLSRNGAYARQMARGWPPKSLAVEVAAAGSRCAKPWCLHDAVITTRPHNPEMYDIPRDYTVFDGERRVVVEYLTKTWALLEHMGRAP